MPRVKSDSCITHRIEFSPVERKMLAEMQENMKVDRMFKQGKAVAQSVGFVALPLGVGIAAYAFWKWAGLGSITIDKMKDGFLGLGAQGGEWIDDTIFGGALGDWFIGDVEATMDGLRDLQDKCNEAIAAQNEILSSPLASANQKAMATMNIKDIKAECIAKEAKLKRKMQDELHAFRERGKAVRKVSPIPLLFPWATPWTLFKDDD